jgi:NADPH:quinone reductase
MRAFQLRAYEGPEGLELTDVAEPAADPDGVLLEIHAVGVNFPDLLLTKGQYQEKPSLPVVPGCEVAGIVRSAPDGSDWEVGDRAAAFVWQGGYAERVNVPLNSIAPVPEGMDLSSAAAMVVNYNTVHFALARRGQLQRGETALVMGAAGGIGTAALQVARGLGARVIAGVADEQQGETARAAGTDEVVVLAEGFSRTVRSLTDDRGVDVVLDPLGDWLFGEAIRALAPEGRILVIGFAAGDIPTLKVNRLLLRNVSAVGVAFGAFLGHAPGLMAEQAESLNRMVSEGIVRPQIGARYDFEDLPDALRRLERGEIPGKAVAEMARD